MKAPKLPPLPPPDSPRVSGWIGVIVIAFYACLVGRLFQLQVLEGAEKAAKTEAQRSRPERVAACSLAARPTRGAFFDAAGRPLAGSHYEHSLAVDLTRFLPPYRKPAPADAPPVVERPEPRRLAERREAARVALATELPRLLAAAGVKVDAEEIASKIAERGLTWDKGEARSSAIVRRMNPEARRKLEAAAEAWRAAGADAEARRVRALAVDALVFEDFVARTYPYGGLFTQILGIVGATDDPADRRVLGRTGLERQFDRLLTGEPGVLGGEQSCGGVRFKFVADQTAPAEDGAEVVLTADVELQRIAFEALRENAKKYKSLRASAVVLDARTGGILAMATIPTTEPGDSFDAKAARVGAVEDALEPGSTVKPLYYAYAFDRGRISGGEGERFDCGGWDKRAVLFGRPITDYSVNPQPLTAVECLYRSSNIGSVRIALERLGLDGVYEAFDKFRLLERPGSGLAGEAAPSIYPRLGDKERGLKPATPRWEGCSFAQGYGLQVSPLGLAAAYTVFATGGERLAPTIVKEVRHGGKTFSPEPRRSRVVSRAAVDFVKKGMLQVIENPRGTAHSTAKSDRYVYCGKTGTSQFDYRNGVTKYYNAWMAAVAPAVDPRIVVVVVHHKVDVRSNSAYTGGSISGPVVRAIVDGVLERLGVPPDRVEELAAGGESR
jgi:cell division protein FtsI/penicillin-binding protein 2